jgi:hypothetical protein
LEASPARASEHFPHGTLSIDKALKASETLRNVKEISREDADRWIGYWVKIGFFAPEDFDIERAHL